MELIIIVVAYVAGVYFFLTVGLPLLGQFFLWLGTALVWVIIMTGRLGWQTTAFTGRFCWKGAALAGKGAYWAGYIIAVFIHEIARGAPQENGEDEAEEQAEEESGEEFEEEEEQTGGGSYEGALALLGLEEGFTEIALNAAYRRAMRGAHPDAPGGSTVAGQKVNAAREAIMRRKGWT